MWMCVYICVYIYICWRVNEGGDWDPCYEESYGAYSIGIGCDFGGCLGLWILSFGSRCSGWEKEVFGFGLWVSALSFRVHVV